jgi:CDGSH-type Zn-finger protein
MKWTAPKSGERWFCTCKQTSNAPFCDSSHKTL